MVVEDHSYYRDAAARKHNETEEEEHANRGALKTRKVTLPC